MDERVYTVHVPAKALLFGEYGVMYGYDALAVTFWEHTFSIEVSFRKTGNNSLEVKSDYFDSGFLKIENVFETQDNFSFLSKSERFFRSLFIPWQSFLRDNSFRISILHSYPKSLGFGSSSAIIASFISTLLIYLKESFHDKENYIVEEDIWKRLYRTLELSQFRGSGYDIAVQRASLQEGKNIKMLPSFWKFRMNSFNKPYLDKVELSNSVRDFGCFVKTGIYSDTSEAIGTFESLRHKDKVEFAKSHGELASEFLAEPNLAQLESLMRRSVTLAKKQNILKVKETSLLNKLENNDIAYKTLGAGLGDCIWVLESPERLTSLGFKSSDIVYCFS